MRASIAQMEDSMIKDRRITLPIADIKEETDEVRTFTFQTDLPAEAGQFIMLTDFNCGEKPFSISDRGAVDGSSGSCGFLSVTIKRVGEFTSRLFSMKTGDILSIRGAYGSSFFIPGTEPESGITFGVRNRAENPSCRFPAGPLRRRFRPASVVPACEAIVSRRCSG